MIALAAALSAATAAGTLAWGFLRTEYPLAALVPFLLGLCWLLSAWQRWRTGPFLLLVIFLGTSAFGIGLGLPDGWALVGSVAALAATDLISFWVRLKEAQDIDASASLEQRHLIRTLAISIASLFLALLGLRLRVRLGLSAALVLGLLAVLGLSRGIALLRKASG